MPHAPMPTAVSLAEPMRSRWSPSIFDDQAVLSAEELRTLLVAAQWAPSNGNTQPWAFLVAERGDAAHAELVGSLSRGNSSWVPRASVVLLAAAQVGPDDQGEELMGAGYACYDLGQAAAHLTLQARALDLHAHQFAGFDREAVAAALGVPAHFRLMSGIAVGRRGDPVEVSERDRQREQRERTRKSLADFVFGVDGWGRPWQGA